MQFATSEDAPPPVSIAERNATEMFEGSSPPGDLVARIWYLVGGGESTQRWRVADSGELNAAVMKAKYKPHVLGIDDGPFEKGYSSFTPIVGVMMEGGVLVEAVAVTEFPIDGDNATAFVGDWIEPMRFAPALQAVIFGGVTIAGLGVIDIEELSRRLSTPVIVVNRKDRTRHRLDQAFEAAGLSERLRVVERMPPIFRVTDGLYAAAAGIEVAAAARLIRATLAKSDLPEPLRVAHLIATAIAKGESRGRP